MMKGSKKIRNLEICILVQAGQDQMELLKLCYLSYPSHLKSAGFNGTIAVEHISKNSIMQPAAQTAARNS